MVNHVRKQELAKDSASYQERYINLKAQARHENNFDTQNQLNKQANNIWEKIEEIDRELNKLVKVENDSYQNYLSIQETLPNIDYKQAVSIVESVTNQFSIDGGAALFLLEDSLPLAGSLLISRIRDKFNSQTRNFRHIKIELSHDGNNSEYALLERFAGYLNYQAESTLTNKNYIENIITKVCQSLQTGSIIFIEINNWNVLKSQEKLIPWFVDEFWIPLIQQCQITTQQKELRRVKFIAVIDSESPLNSECTNLPYYCYQNNFDSKKMLRLPLNLWTQLDIQEWLDCYSGLQKPASEIDSIAEQIYNKTRNGLPFMVCEELKKLKV